ncbi:uncharacterized protein LOC135398796 [Ornithodoros turicata]|uniref:uncharacterized protein LOC135398796 n=1 Tax=Ornithodoros turicata TaxID=34597 RepID=UPI0031391A73
MRKATHLVAVRVLAVVVAAGLATSDRDVTPDGPHTHDAFRFSRFQGRILQDEVGEQDYDFDLDWPRTHEALRVNDFLRFARSGRVLLGYANGEPALVGALFARNEGMWDCAVAKGREPVAALLKFLPPGSVAYARKTTFLPIFVACYNLQGVNHRARSPSRWRIYPGTKWCGDGNIAANYDDVGDDKDVDKCCRAHDHSGETIPPRGTLHGIINYRHYTMSTCEADMLFFGCLKETKSVIAEEVGFLYFDILSPSCYGFDHPHECKDGTTPVEECTEFIVREDKPKVWQKFNNPTFTPEEEEEIDEATHGAQQPQHKSMEEEELVEHFQDTEDEDDE